MKIAILSRNPELYSTQRLVEAGLGRGHDVRVIDYARCYMGIKSHGPTVHLAREALAFDAVIPRVGASETFYGTAIVRQFEMMGTFTTNESQAISRARDKLRSLQLLSRAGIGLPVTGMAHSTKDVDGLIDLVGGAPLIVKLVEGTQGIGVVKCETREAAESVIAAFRQLNAFILVQEFIAEAKGCDIRAFVVDGRVVAAMMREAKPGEFRANIHRGGKATRIKLTPEERAISVRAAKAIGLNVAGVDLLRSNHGPVVIEVNASPGLEGIEGASGVDVAGKIYEFVEKNAVRGSSRDKIGA